MANGLYFRPTSSKPGFRERRAGRAGRGGATDEPAQVQAPGRIDLLGIGNVFDDEEGLAESAFGRKLVPVPRASDWLFRAIAEIGVTTIDRISSIHVGRAPTPDVLTETADYHS